MSQPYEDSKSNEHEETHVLLDKQDPNTEKKLDVNKTLDSLEDEKQKTNYSWWSTCLHVFVYISFGTSVLVAFASAFFYIITTDSILEFMSFAIIIVTTWVGSVIGIIATWKGVTLHQIKFKLQKLNDELKNLITRRQTSVNSLNRQSLHFAQMNDKLRVKWIDLKNENNQFKNQNKRLNKANQELEQITQGLDETLSFCPLIQQQLKEQNTSINNMQTIVSLFEEIKKYYNKVYLLEIYYKYRKSRQGDAKTMNIKEWANFIKALDKHSKKDAELRKIYYKWNPDALDHFMEWQFSDENDDGINLKKTFKYYDFNKTHIIHLEPQDYMEASVFEKHFPKSTCVFKSIAKGDDTKQSDDVVSNDEKESDDDTISIREFETEVETIFNDAKVCFWSTVHEDKNKSTGNKRKRRGTIA
eukprot:8811_1